MFLYKRGKEKNPPLKTVKCKNVPRRMVIFALKTDMKTDRLHVKSKILSFQGRRLEN